MDNNNNNNINQNFHHHPYHHQLRHLNSTDRRLMMESRWRQLIHNGFNPVVPMNGSTHRSRCSVENMPCGFRFQPRDVELIDVYLKNKLKNEALPLGLENLIFDVKLYDHNPQELIGMHPLFGKVEDGDRYFFTPRERKYQRGSRPRRTVGDGYWKVTGKNIPITKNDAIIGYKKVLDFYKGEFKGGVKTEWKMHEYLTKEQELYHSSPSTSHTTYQLDECVLCKIYKNKRSKGDERQEGDQEADPINEIINEFFDETLDQQL